MNLQPQDELLLSSLEELDANAATFPIANLPELVAAGFATSNPTALTALGRSKLSELRTMKAARTPGGSGR